jgi:hypothetical protein
MSFGWWTILDTHGKLDAGTKTALNKLNKAISKQGNAHPVVALLVAGDFNAGKLKSVLPHFYSTSMSHVQPERKDDVLLIPAYKQKPKQQAPVIRSIQKWPDDADATLQDCFASTDLNMFWDSSNGIEEYTTSVTGFINKCIDDVVPTVTICTYPNQKPWISGNICIELKARVAALKEPDTNLGRQRSLVVRALD